MVLVRGNDQYTGIEIAPEQIWNTAALSGFQRVHPLIDDTFSVEAQPLPRPQNLGAGSEPLAVYDTGRQLVRGTFTVYPTYNAAWMFYLEGQVHGGIEGALPGVAPNGAIVTGIGTHVYFPQPFNATNINGVGAIGNGFTIRAWRSGPTNAGYVDVFTGCIVTKKTWDQPDEDRPRVTYEFIGALSTTAQIGVSGGPMTTLFASPTANDTPGAWTNPNNIRLNDATFATTTTNASGVTATAFPNIAAKIPPAGIVQGIVVAIDAKKTDSGGTSTLQFGVQVSWDGGSTWSTSKPTTNLTASEVTYSLGTGTTDTWGHTWTLAELSALRVRVTSAGTVVGTPTWHLDYIVVTCFVLDTQMRDIQPGIVEIGLRDFKGQPTHATLPGVVKIGQTTAGAHSQSDIETRGFRLILDAHMDVAPPHLTSLDSTERPGHVEPWEMTGEIRAMLQQDYDSANKPHNLYRNKYNANIRIRYCSATAIPGSSPSVPYCYDIILPNVVFTASPDSVSDPQPTVTWPFACIKDAYGILNGEWSAAGNWPFPWMFQIANDTQVQIGYSITPADGLDSGIGRGDDTFAVADTGSLLTYNTLTAIPTAQTPGGSWGTDHNAWAAGGGTTDTTAPDDIITYQGFDFSAIPTDAIIDTVNVTMIAKKDESAGSGTLSLELSLSYDDGTHYTSNEVDSLTTSLVEAAFGGVAGRFGRDWTSAELQSGALKVKVQAKGTAILDDVIWQLDYIEVKVNYWSTLVLV